MLTKTQDIKDGRTKPRDPRYVEPTREVILETDIRSCVKRAGGFRKGLPEAEMAQAIDWLRELNGLMNTNRTPADGWDETIRCPGHDDILAGAPRLNPGAMTDAVVLHLQRDVIALTQQNQELMAQMKAALSQGVPTPDVTDDPRYLVYMAETVASLRTFCEEKRIELPSGSLTKPEIVTLLLNGLGAE